MLVVEEHPGARRAEADLITELMEYQCGRERDLGPVLLTVTGPWNEPF